MTVAVDGALTVVALLASRHRRSSGSRKPRGIQILEQQILEQQLESCWPRSEHFQKQAGSARCLGVFYMGLLSRGVEIRV